MSTYIVMEFSVSSTSASSGCFLYKFIPVSEVAHLSQCVDCLFTTSSHKIFVLNFLSSTPIPTAEVSKHPALLEQ